MNTLLLPHVANPLLLQSLQMNTLLLLRVANPLLIRMLQLVPVTFFVAILSRSPQLHPRRCCLLIQCPMVLTHRGLIVVSRHNSIVINSPHTSLMIKVVLIPHGTPTHATTLATLRLLLMKFIVAVLLQPLKLLSTPIHLQFFADLLIQLVINLVVVVVILLVEDTALAGIMLVVLPLLDVLVIVLVFPPLARPFGANHLLLYLIISKVTPMVILVVVIALCEDKSLLRPATLPLEILVM
jgi:hypothetical protein